MAASELADRLPGVMLFIGGWKEGETGSSFSATMGGCKVLSVGKAWLLCGCILLGPDTDAARTGV